MASNLFCLEQAQRQMCIDLLQGARIVEFSFAGRNVLASEAPEVGSTFWPSPQSSWGWPPPAVLDKAPYQHRWQGRDLIATSGVCSATGLVVEKRFSLSAEGAQIEYFMHNASDRVLSYAPWEITRLNGGLTFYQSSQQPLPHSTGQVEAAKGYHWHEYQPQHQQDHEKVFANGSSGWLANYHAGLLLIKSFAPVAADQVAPGEGEIEIYRHGDQSHAYIEIEQQGPYVSLAPGSRCAWLVHWYLVPVAEQRQYAMGDAELINLVENYLQRVGRKSPI